MTTRYEVVKAANAAEALQKSKFKVGDLVKIIEVEAVANSDKTFSVFPIIEPLKGEDHAV